MKGNRIQEKLETDRQRDAGRRQTGRAQKNRLG